MYQKEIVNPKTGKTINVKTWKIQPRQVLELLKQGKIQSAKDLSYLLLNNEESLACMEEQQFGDSSSNNFALNVFEHALDWSLGLVVLNFIKQAVKIKKLPKPFEVGVSRSGNIYLILNTGRVIPA